MRHSIVFVLLAAALAVEAGSSKHHRHHRKSDTCHRRHHGKAGKKGGKSSKSASRPSTSSSSSGATTSVTGASSSLGSSNATDSSSNTGTLSGVTKSGIYLGFLPDDGDAGGSRQTMAQLNSAMGGQKAATYGWYAQAHSGTTFDGSQLLAVMDDLKASGAIFEPAVMPTGGWQGLTSGDNSQAQAICNVMKQFTDEGIEVRLRFAHEVNWYQTDGTYQGTASDFKEGWATVAAACQQIAPSVKMFFTPNVANLQQYQQFYPDDHNTVDLCGIDFYPQSIGDTTFVDTMKGFHDYCTANGKTKFAIGETGLGFAGSSQQRVQWLEQIMSTATQQAMPNFVSISWFNYQKGYDFKIIDPNDSSLNSVTMNFLS